MFPTRTTCMPFCQELDCSCFILMLLLWMKMIIYLVILNNVKILITINATQKMENIFNIIFKVLAKLWKISNLSNKKKKMEPKSFVIHVVVIAVFLMSYINIATPCLHHTHSHPYNYHSPIIMKCQNISSKESLPYLKKKNTLDELDTYASFPNFLEIIFFIIKL